MLFILPVFVFAENVKFYLVINFETRMSRINNIKMVRPDSNTNNSWIIKT